MAISAEYKMLLSMLCGYPIAILLRRIPPAGRAVASIILALFFMTRGLNGQTHVIRAILYTASGAYGIAACIRGKWMPWLGFSFVLGRMFCFHLTRQVTVNLQDSDIAASVYMVIVTKLVMFCWNVHDGRQEIKDLAPCLQQQRLTSLPSVVDFAGYLTFFPSMLSGPTFDFYTYKTWLAESHLGDVHESGGLPKQNTQNSYQDAELRRRAVRRAVTGLLWLAFSYKCSIWSNVPLLLSAKFSQYNFLQKIGLLQILAYSMRFKMYGLWSISEGAAILSGIGYCGIDPNTGDGLWPELENFDAWKIETAQNPYHFVGSWNIKIHKWLHNYLYIRLATKGKRPGPLASLATFVVSAVWHGQWAGYYATFVMGSLIHIVARDIRRYIRPFFLPITASTKSAKTHKSHGREHYHDFHIPKVVYDGAGILLTHISFSFTTAPVAILSLRASIQLWSQLHFIVPVITLALIGFFNFPGVKQCLMRMRAAQQTEYISTTGTDVGIPIEPKLKQHQSSQARPNVLSLLHRRISSVAVSALDFASLGTTLMIIERSLYSKKRVGMERSSGSPMQLWLNQATAKLGTQMKTIEG